MGKWAEAEARKYLEARSDRDFGFAFHRYPDARAARGSLPAQPSDYIVALKDVHHHDHWHIEVKETAQERRLPKAKIRQYGMLKKFWWAGTLPLVPVFRSTLDDWVCLTHAELFATDDAPVSFLIDNLATFRTINELLDFYIK